MKFVKNMRALCVFLFAGAVAFHLLETGAWAAANESGWRSNYDLIMMWLNFAILAFVLIKYAKNPVKRFLQDQKDSIAESIKAIEVQKEANDAEIKQAQQLLQESSARFEAVKERIISEGERRKQAIIESAQRESKLMIEQANFWVERQIQQAKQRLRSELIDESIEQALQLLPQKLTPEDNQKFINNYLNEIEALTK
jgi:F-type H+-transporting ATPase subunit b